MPPTAQAEATAVIQRAYDELGTVAREEKRAEAASRARSRRVRRAQAALVAEATRLGLRLQITSGHSFEGGKDR